MFTASILKKTHAYLRYAGAADLQAAEGDASLQARRVSRGERGLFASPPIFAESIKHVLCHHMFMFHFAKPTMIFHHCSCSCSLVAMIACVFSSAGRNPQDACGWPLQTLWILSAFSKPQSRESTISIIPARALVTVIPCCVCFWWQDACG